MLSKLLNIFRIPDLRNKVLFTVALLCVYRIGFYIPLPGINAPQLAESMKGTGGAFQMLANYLSVFSGGDLTQGTIFGLGIMPYISASIIIQLLGTVVPSLEKLRKEGEPGVRKLNEWTRYLAVVVCVFQAIMYVAHFAPNTPEAVKDLYDYVYLTNSNKLMFLILAVASLTAGSIFLMWLGEQIETFGIGNGVSLIIAAGIISRMPLAIHQVADNFSIDGSAGKIGLGPVLFLIVCFVFVVGSSILLTQAQRRIPIQQAKHMRGRRVYGGTKQYLPLRVNHAGVMPIIFASTLLQLPIMGIAYLADRSPQGIWRNFLEGTRVFLTFGRFPYLILFCLMIFFFSYFWNTVQFQPKEMANQLRDYGSFIPGLRPGKRTADYLENVMARITYVGAGFLCVIAIIPSVIATFLLKDMGQNQAFQITQFLGGTGLLIVISVMLDFINRIEANLVMRNYGGFMDENGGGGGGRNKRPRGGAAKSSSSYSDNPREQPA